MSPLVNAVMATHHLDYQTEWLSILHGLQSRLGCRRGSLSFAVQDVTANTRIRTDPAHAETTTTDVSMIDAPPIRPCHRRRESLNYSGASIQVSSLDVKDRARWARKKQSKTILWAAERRRWVRAADKRRSWTARRLFEGK